MPREAETKVDKHYSNQTRQVSNQGPDQTDDTWPDQRTSTRVRSRAVSSSQPKASRYETSPTSTDNQLVTLGSVASLTSISGTWIHQPNHITPRSNHEVRTSIEYHMQSGSKGDIPFPVHLLSWIKLQGHNP